VSSNRFEVLKVRVMQRGEGSGKEVVKDRKKILRKERTKRGGRDEIDKGKKEGEKGETAKRGDSEDWVKAGGRRRGSINRSIVG